MKLLLVYQRIIFKSEPGVRKEYEYKVFGRKGGNLSKDIEDDIQHVEACCLGQRDRGLLFNNVAPDLKQKSLFVFHKAFLAACPLREAETSRWLSINRKKHLKFPREVHRSVHTFYVARLSWWGLY